MKLLHLSDLHLGKRVNEFPMLEDQRAVLAQIAEMARQEKPDGVLIAGDVYDRPVPPGEAVTLFDDFLVRLRALNIPVFLLSGNHDSPERLAFGGRLMAESGVHVAPLYNGTVSPLSLTDAYGRVDIYLLPFLRPAQVRAVAGEDAEIVSYTDAMRFAISRMPLDDVARNVLVTHQFVAGAAPGESEDLSVGGTDCVAAEVFAPFDYVALGHIHRAQQVSSSRIRYCGAPLRYALSEAGQEKSVTLVELGEKGTLSVRALPLTMPRGMALLRGKYEELTARAFYEGTTYPEDYVQITLTDEEDVAEALGRLRVIYPYLMRLEYDNRRTRCEGVAGQAPENVPERTPFALLAELYRRQNGREMTELQRELAERCIRIAFDGENPTAAD